MVGLPEIGARVHVWPARANVQDGPRAVSEGGRFLAPEGREVVWSYHHLDQMRAGDLYLHDPSPAQAKAEKKGKV